MKMSYFSLGKVVLVSMVTFSFGLLSWELIPKKEPADIVSIREKSSIYPIRLQGISNSIYDNNRIIAKMEADEFKVNPRKFFVFNVKSLNEITITNVKLEIYYNNDNKNSSNVDLIPLSQLQFSEFKEGNRAKNGMGLITRGIVKGLSLRVYKANQLSLVVKAKEAHINFRNREMRMKNASIEEVISKRLIESKSIIWDNEQKLFDIPGEYIIVTSREKAKGKGIKVGIDFELNPLAL